MDAVDFASGSRKKHIRNEDVGLGKDFISNLPDEILHQIVSFLPTKDLVRTSVLSKRWQKVWTYFHVIDIDLDSLDDNRELKAGFLVLVEKAMLFPSTARIRKFRLRLSAPVADASDVMAWMDKVMEHKVQELDLALPKQTFYSLPDQLFSSNSLTELRLAMDCELTVPDSVCFPRLKMLRLSLVKFSSVRSTEKLFSSCPVLEELALKNCIWDRINGIVIHFTSLRKFSICYDIFYPEDSPASKVKVFAPSLLSVKCRIHSPMELDLCNLSSLEDASIDVVYLYRAKLLHQIQGAKSLIVSTHIFENCSFDKEFQASLPTFHNMKHIHVRAPLNGEIPREVVEFLHKTPNLHSLTFDQALEPYAFEEEWILNIVPQCFKTSLKRFELGYFDGTEAEYRLLKYLLENATLLENMSIFLDEGDLEDKEDIRYELELSRGAASSCKIEFLE